MLVIFQLSHLITKSHCDSMQASRSDGAGGQGIHFVPKSGQYKNLLIFLHGLGDTADNWASIMPSLQIADTKIVLPTARMRPILFDEGMLMSGR